MAKANSVKFPKWAPAVVIRAMNDYRDQLKHYGADDPRRDCPDMLRRLLEYEGMQAVWDALQLSKKPLPAAIFAAAAAHGFCGPRGEEQRTPAQHRAWLDDVQKLSARLSKMLRGTDLDRELISHLDLRRGDVGHALWGRFSEILDSVSSGASYLAAPSAGKRTHGEDARRAYFVRHLTAFFREYIGGPRRELVAIATAAAFDDPSFGARQVKRLAP